MDSANLDPLINTLDQKTFKAYNNMLFGKKVTSSDVSLVIKNVPYETNKQFIMYENDVLLDDKDFYCIVNEESFYHVYKCLDNNNGAKSTVEPLFVYFTSADNFVFRASDGYVWKYMYTVPNAQVKKFSSTNFFPVVTDANVSSNAINGSIDVVKVLSGGKGYDNYSNGIFSITDLRVNGDGRRYRINKSAANGYFSDCILYLSAGPGAGQYATISQYFSNANGNFIDIDQEFNVQPTNQTQYQINPKVNFKSNGKETSIAVGRALINAASTNSVYRVEMLRGGANYEYATCAVSANVNVGVDAEAALKPIIAPYNGHGFNAEKELLASRVCFSVKMSNTENGTIIANNTFKQVGIMKDPRFAQTAFTISNVSSSFITGETIYKVNPVRVQANVTVNTFSTTVTCSNALFTSQVAAGQFLYIKGHESTQTQLDKVQSVTNSSHFILASNCNFTSTNAEIYIANPTSEAKVLIQQTETLLYVDSVYGVFSTGDIIMGATGGCKANVETVSRNGMNKGFDTFVQMYKYTGTKESGSFAMDEIIYQGNSLATSTANATLHSYKVDGTSIEMYLSNVKGEFNIFRPFYGTYDSGIAIMSQELKPELVYASGDILYVENIDNITRSNTQSEEFKVVFEF